MRICIKTCLSITIVFMVIITSTASPRVTLTGKIVDSTGKPVEHATILIYKAGVKTGYSTYCPSCYADCGKRTMTNTEGTFTIKNLNPDLLFTLLVVRDGYNSEFVKSVDPMKGPAPNAVLKTRQLVNDPQRVVRGRIVDSHGRSLRDAIVQPIAILFNDNKSGHIMAMGGDYPSDPIAVTNNAGEFDISYKSPVMKALLLVEARGFAPKLFNQLSTGLDRHVLKVTNGATLSGRLIHNGKPVAGAQIGLVPRNRGIGAELKLNGDLYDEMRIGTKSDGTFVFTNVPAPVEWYVYGKMESISGRGATMPVRCATKTDGEDANIGDIHITHGYRLRGRIVLSDGNSIIEGMRVSIATDSGTDAQTVFLRSDGSFEFVGLAPGKYTVFASVRGYRDPYWDFIMKAPRPGEVQIEKDTNDFRLTLDPIK